MRRKYAAIVISVFMVMNHSVAFANIYKVPRGHLTDDSFNNDTVTENSNENITTDNHIQENIISEKNTSDLVIYKDASSDTVISNDVSSDTVISDDPSSDTVISDDPSSDSVISDDPSSDTVISDDPSSDTVISDVALSDTITSIRPIPENNASLPDDDILPMEVSESDIIQEMIPDHTRTESTENKQVSKNQADAKYSSTETIDYTDSIWDEIKEKLPPLAPNQVCIIKDDINNIFCYDSDNILWASSLDQKGIVILSDKAYFPQNVKNDIKLLVFSHNLTSISPENLQNINNLDTIHFEHDKNDYLTDSIHTPLLTEKKVYTIQLDDDYYLDQILNLIGPNAAVNILISLDAPMWKDYTSKQLHAMLDDPYIIPRFKKLIDDSNGRIKTIYPGSIYTDEDDDWDDSWDYDYNYDMEYGYNHTGEIIDLATNKPIISTSVYVGDDNDYDYSFGETDPYYSTNYSTIQDDAYVTVYSPYAAAPLQDRDLLWLKYSDILSSSNIRQLSTYMDTNGVMETLPVGDYIVDTVFLTDSNLLILRLVNESSSGDLTHASLYADLYSVENGSVVLSDSKLLYQNIGSTLKHLELLSGPGQGNAVLYLEGICLSNDSSNNAWIIENGKIIDSNRAGGTQKNSNMNNSAQADTLFSYNLAANHAIEIFI